MKRMLAGMAVFVMSAPAAALAQDATGRVAVEAVASASVTSANHDPFLIFDAIGTIHVANGWDAVVRPWARRMPPGDWAAEMYQLQLRYTSSTRVPFRLDAGIIASPIGLSTLTPATDGKFDGKTLISGGYPLGAIASASGTKWDARAGVTDSSPTRAANVFSAERPARALQIIAGGGVTPRAGLRFGAAVSRGAYRTETRSLTGTITPAQDATTVTLEGEYAIGYTRVQGEWISDRFETSIAPATARGFNVEVLRTLTPRWFAAARGVRASSPVLAGPAQGRRAANALEATLGYRVTRAVTLRGGYQGMKPFNSPARVNAAAVSIVWAQRWW